MFGGGFYGKVKEWVNFMDFIIGELVLKGCRFKKENELYIVFVVDLGFLFCEIGIFKLIVE